METVARTSFEQKNGRQSFFDGGLLQLIGWTILGTVATVFSLGLLYPWSLCKLFGWRINHTVVDGRRLTFSGTAFGLFGNWLKWWLLTVITLGIYSFWVRIKLEDWKVRHTHFVN
ncbi:membrane protein [Alkalibacterium psychrotolerans]